MICDGREIQFDNKEEVLALIVKLAQLVQDVDRKGGTNYVTVPVIENERGNCFGSARTFFLDVRPKEARNVR